MKALYIPKRIIEYAQHLSENGFQNIFREDRLDVLRDQALECIRRYKEAKREDIDKANAQQEITEWLKSIGHETRK